MVAPCSPHLTATRLAVTGDRAFHAQIDGDYWGRAVELEVEIMPGAVRIIAPSPPPARP